MDMQFAKAGVPNFGDTNISLGPRYWFAVFTKSHHEKRVSQHFLQRGIENFLSLYSEVHHWTNRRKAEIDLPVFPNYIFVHIAADERVPVLQIPGVLSIVSRGRDPAPLADFEIEALRDGLHLRKIEPHPYLAVGEKVRIKSGSLVGMQGVLVRKKSNLRVVITLEQIMQSVSVEVDAAELEACRS